MKPLKYGVNEVPGSGIIEVLRNQSTPTGRMFKISLPDKDLKNEFVPQENEQYSQEDSDNNSYFEIKKNALHNFIKKANPKTWDEEWKIRQEWQKINDNEESKKIKQDLDSKFDEKDETLENIKKAANLDFVIGQDPKYYEENPKEKEARRKTIELFPEYEELEKEWNDLAEKSDILNGKYRFYDTLDPKYQKKEKGFF